jgi:flagellar basal body-associated protein FliL
MKKKLIIIIVVIVLLLAIGAGLYFFVFAAPPPEKITSCYTPGDYFVTNIKDSTSLIKTTIVLELSVYEKDLWILRDI